MNRDETKQAIAVMQHFANGGSIRFRGKGENGWIDVEDGDSKMSWDWDNYEYRIKPKSLECWVWTDVSVAVSKNAQVHGTQVHYTDEMPKPIHHNGRWVRMREVENEAD